jgi:hypothetical protein
MFSNSDGATPLTREAALSPSFSESPSVWLQM